MAVCLYSKAQGRKPFITTLLLGRPLAMPVGLLDSTSLRYTVAFHQTNKIARQRWISFPGHAAARRL